MQKYSIQPEHAARFGSLPMQSYNGRIMPVNTFSSEILRKIYRKEQIGNLNSDQFLLSLVTLPEMWKRVPLIRYSNKEIAWHFDLPEKNAAYVDFFDANGNYKLLEIIEHIYHKNRTERSSFEKDIIKLDEKVNILHQVLQFRMVHIIPASRDPEAKWLAPGDDLTVLSGTDSLSISGLFESYSKALKNGMQTGEWAEADHLLNQITILQQSSDNPLILESQKIKAELKYNRLNIFGKCKKIYLLSGGILLILSFLFLFVKSKWITGFSRLIQLMILAGLFYHLYGMGLRWYISGHAPWSNSYETMVYISWITVLAGFLMVRYNTMVVALATLFGGVILFVSGLNWMDPQINPLVPVLKSPWLMFHVAVIVAAYGFFGVSFLTGITNMILMSIRSYSRHVLTKELTIINEMCVWTGLALLTTGTFLGAVWANESWGRYWGWDPKETWALVSVIVYAIVLHLRLVKRWDNPWLFNTTSVIAFFSVLMTYFGVNFFLSGMHSYG